MCMCGACAFGWFLLNMGTTAMPLLCPSHEKDTPFKWWFIFCCIVPIARFAAAGTSRSLNTPTRFAFLSAREKAIEI